MGKNVVGSEKTWHRSETAEFSGLRWKDVGKYVPHPIVGAISSNPEQGVVRYCSQSIFREVKIA